MVIDGQPWPYEVSDFGRVRRSEPAAGPRPGRTFVGKILKPSPDRGGYLQVSLFQSDKIKYPYIHRLVLEAFVGPCPEKHQTNHLDGVKHNNRIENLEWVTARANNTHAYQMGLRSAFTPKGSKNGSSKLTENDVFEIRRRLAQGELQKDVALDFRISRSTISNIATGRRWGWL